MNIRNKKGDITITTVILITLGLVVLVMLIVGFTKGTDFFFNAFDSGPSELQTLAKACEGYVAAGLSIDFCTYRLVDISGDDELVNCNDDRIEASLSSSSTVLPAHFKTCNLDDQNKRNACLKIAEGKRNLVRINSGTNCATLLTTSTGCKGTPTACSSLAQSTCQTQRGCSWNNNACSGIATVCTDTAFTTETLCKAQQGCMWS